MHQIIADKREEIAVICRKYDIAKLEVFGSASRAVDFDPAKSDVDFLVSFNPPLLPGLFGRRMDMREDLQKLFARKVDLIHFGTIRNPYRLASIEEDREMIYEE